MKHDILAPLPADAKSNPRAASVRILAKSLSRAYGQRRHDLRIGKQPDYVVDERSHLNRNLAKLRPLSEIQRENDKLRDARGRVRKMKSNAAVVMIGIITFGHEAQVMFAGLSREQQDEAYLELAQRVAERLGTRLESLVVHVDETAPHAHFMLRGYTDDGEPVSKVATYAMAAELQDITAEVMQTYCPKIERGNKKWDRIANGADYADTLNRSVKQLHQELPHEMAAKEAVLQALVDQIALLQSSLEKAQRQSTRMEARRNKTAQQLKTARKYEKRLANKEIELTKLNAEMDQARVNITAMQDVLKAKQTRAEERDAAHVVAVQNHIDKTAEENAKIAEEQAALVQMKAAHDEEVRDAQAAATERKDAAKVAEEKQILARNELTDARMRTTAYVDLANEAAAELSKSEAANAVALACAEAARREASQANGFADRAHAEERAAIEAKMAALAVKVEAEAATEREVEACQKLQSDRKEAEEQLNAKHASIAGEKRELQNGIVVFKAVLDEFSNGTLKRDRGGRVRMLDDTSFEAAPEWVRSALSPLRDRLADLREEVGTLMSNLQKQITKIAVFLKRKDLTVEAREEAKSLRDHGPGDDF